MTPNAFSLAVAGFPTRAVAVIAVLALTCLVLLYNATVLRRRRRRELAELQHATRDVAALVDAAPDAILLVDAAGALRALNPAAERLLGHRSEDVTGRPIAELCAEPSRALLSGAPSEWPAAVADAPLRLHEAALRRADGSEVPVELSVGLAPAETGRPSSATVFVRDVSARRRTERLQGLRYTVAGVLAEARSVAEAGDGVLAAIGTRLHVPLALLWSPAGTGLAVERAWTDRDGRATDLLRLSRQTTITVGSALPGRAWSGGRTLGSDDGVGGEDDDRAAAARSAGLPATAAVPVIAEDRVLAVLEVFAASATDLDDETVRTLDDIAGQLGQLVARRRAEAVQDSPERLVALLESARDAHLVIAEDGAIVGLNASARRLFGVSSLEVVGDDLRILVVEADRDRVIGYVSTVLGLTPGSAPRFLDVEARRRDGSTLDVGMRITPLRVGGRNAFLCVIDDLPPAEARGGTGLHVLPGDPDVQRPRLA